MLIDRKGTVRFDQMPLRVVVSRRLARDNSMLANLLVLALGSGLIGLVRRVRVAGELLVQCAAGELAPVQTWRLLRRVVAEADGDHLLAVGGAEVEAVGRGLVAQVFLLELHDLHDGFVHRAQHLGDGILLRPRVFGAVLGQVGNV